MQSNVSRHGMAVAPHHLASHSAMPVLREGGSAIEAMGAAAATIALVYPHMNGLGGDGFWLIVPPQGEAIAIDYAQNGAPVTASQAHATASKFDELKDLPGFAETWLVDGKPPQVWSRFYQPSMATTLTRLVEDGLDSFYRGPLAEVLAHGMETLGLPVTLAYLHAHVARRTTPLVLQHQQGEIFNHAPPTQGLVSLAILGITDRLNMADDAGTIHHIVEATKLAFGLRDAHITDPRELNTDIQRLLDPAVLQTLAERVDDSRAAPWGSGKGPGDTVWMGVMDNSGLAVSFIQSIYHEFGSGVVLPDTGIVWQNRGASFRLDPDHPLALAPGKQPFHTLNPAAARLKDGRVRVYGSMGGDGQPQTQATLFTRYLVQGMPLQESITPPRWLLGRTWGQTSDTLKLEGRFTAETVSQLRARGHEVEISPYFSEAMGHAGAIVRHHNGLFEGTFDPRSNGAAARF
ncbi:gamma-glutamyltransferase (plasmid) [Serratia symbiotica]|uniref:gamma-glutamyltransferase family protein n=1 Tax=Serratia symbiotica TaxID=138074 RepID=UPI00209053D3|nr:gamma-glutamyltransferase [Serratia symbiotica]USS96905.1 gamma-glutamyltransferase [Serratia symbiotica]